MMKIIKFASHCDPDQALTMIQFLNELKDQLWELYGEDIIEQHQENKAGICRPGEVQLDLYFEDDLPF